MGRGCIVCGNIFGCIRGKVKYLCRECRLMEGCGIRNHFTTTWVSKEICEECTQDLQVMGGTAVPRQTPRREQNWLIGLN
jgi:hypothetical protein